MHTHYTYLNSLLKPHTLNRLNRINNRGTNPIKKSLIGDCFSQTIAKNIRKKLNVYIKHQIYK